MSLTDFKGVYVLFLFGLGLSLVSFFYEVIVHKMFWIP